MDLRDRFAACFAAALVDAFADEGQVAQRAYDLAEAMLAERARRMDADEERALAQEPRRGSIPPVLHPIHPAFHSAFHSALLDEPEPMIEPDPGHEEDVDPAWLEPPYDPSWDLETRWGGDPSSEAIAARSAGHDGGPSKGPPNPSGPGLVRTQPQEAEEAPRRERSA
jgi:hypothetical protein